VGYYNLIMSENNDAQSGFGAAIVKGLIKKAHHHLEMFDAKTSEGALEQADAHFTDAVKAIKQLVSSPDLFIRLTPQERNQYADLQDKSNHGLLTNEEIEQFRYLGNKAVGNIE
jgi:hypothetical protein